MKKKGYGTVLMSMLLVGSVVGWMTFNSSQDPQPTVEYQAVCRNLPANAHWTSGGTRKEIPQTESSPNVWTPSPIGTYGTSKSDTECHFVCDDGYGWNGATCNVVRARAACETEEITFSGFTIAKCNVGATVAGTGKLNKQDGCVTFNNGTSCWSESLGDYFQRGNTYGFANSGTLSTSSNLVPNAIAYGPLSYYSGSTFITDPGVTDVSKYDYWIGGQNDHLRGGSGDTEANGRDSGNARTERQGPCPDGYHMPSAGEWSGLVMTRWNTVGSGGSTISIGSGLPYFSDTAKATAFRNDFLLPLAGFRDYDSFATVYDQGNYSYYWSSSPNGSNARNLFLSTSSVYADYYVYRAYGFSVRCFKDS